MENTVWVLGAGFSKSLGGPLLADLLSVSSHQDLDAFFDADSPLRSSHTTDAFLLYHYGRRFNEGWVGDGNRPPSLVGESLWEHAEEFLDKLETAAQNPEGAWGWRFRRIHRRISGARSEHELWSDERPLELQAVRDAARRVVATECAIFSRFLDPATETCAPYVQWANKLKTAPNSAADTIINFNYDLVLEKLGLADAVLLPASADSRKSKAPVILKLHGSVGWCRKLDEATASFTHVNDVGDTHMFVDECEAKELAIATPGLAKQATSKELAPLWRRAVSALKAADCIVFVGYRFPPTDAEARGELLQAIQQNSSRHLSLHVVLGPNTALPDVVRLGELLNYAAQNGGRVKGARLSADQTYRVKVHPLWAEDFLGVFERRLLTNPPS